MKWMIVVVAAGGVGVASGGAWAQPADEPDALAGPDVASAASRPTLVHRAFDGSIRRLEVSPEEAALERLDLDEESQGQVQEVLDARNAVLDEILVKHIGLLLKYQAAAAAEDRLEILRVLTEVWRATEPLRERGTLREELGRVLNQDRLSLMDEMVAEYDEALLAEARAQAEASGERFREVRYRIAEGLRRLGEDLKRSYERAVTAGVEEFEALLVKLQLEPEHEREVRRLVQDFAQATMLNPTAQQRRELGRKIFAVLSQEERLRALRELYGSGR
ncbi:MAG: hypothetical protein H6811_05160 [Phycisphaeraceae bacterium]|nr:hypothetical protein [Phycisphaeraceae bacterium]